MSASILGYKSSSCRVSRRRKDGPGGERARVLKRFRLIRNNVCVVFFGRPYSTFSAKLVPKNEENNWRPVQNTRSNALFAPRGGTAARCGGKAPGLFPFCFFKLYPSRVAMKSGKR